MCANYKKILLKIVSDASENAKVDMRKLAMSGLEEGFKIYYKPATDHDAGQVKAFRKSISPDSSWVLVNDDILDINVAYDKYSSWIHSRVQSLPLLPIYC